MKRSILRISNFYPEVKNVLFYKPKITRHTRTTNLYQEHIPFLMKTMKDHKVFFDLFSCCIPVKGSKRSTICDVQKNKYVILPTIVVEVILKNKTQKKDVHALEKIYGPEIILWLNKLRDNDYGHFFSDVNEYRRFPDIKLDHFEYNGITNSIIDFDEKSQHDTAAIAAELSQLFCEAVELRYFFSPSIERLKNDVQYFRDSTIRSIEVVTGFYKNMDSFEYKQLIKSNERIHRVTVHSSPLSKFYELGDDQLLSFIETNIDSELHCGIVSPDLFCININTVRDNNNVNSCLYKKISVDRTGAIKNCPSSKKCFGNLKDTSLSEALNHPEFKEYWKINKNQISVCRDCEFRLICIDCRVFIDDTDDIYSKPKKCKYDPYSAKYVS